MPEEVSLSDAIASVRRELLNAQNSMDPTMPFEVNEIEIELGVEVERTGEGSLGVNVWAVQAKLGGQKAHTGTHRLKVTLKPLDPTSGRSARVGSLQDTDPLAPPTDR